MSQQFDITTEEEAKHYRLFCRGSALTPARFWSYALVDKRKGADKLEYWERNSTELNIQVELEKYGRIPIKFLIS